MRVSPENDARGKEPTQEHGRWGVATPNHRGVGRECWGQAQGEPQVVRDKGVAASAETKLKAEEGRRLAPTGGGRIRVWRAQGDMEEMGDQLLNGDEWGRLRVLLTLHKDVEQCLEAPKCWRGNRGRERDS